MNRTLIAAATAITIGLGALGASTTSAAAANIRGSAHFQGPGYSITIGNRGWNQRRHFNRQCRPIFKTKRVFVPRHGWTLAKVKVGQRCHRPHRRYWW